ncbi:MAG: hypothetical protein A3F85_01920 [Candidatus Ryanbacteria bacterium RIFCSPLOWO2_12_FULL_44_26]|nr:MAG: hypothetical protein A3F85_01920 [Candidatus Ryanbacteria bacterium RIFCSPLOWO2_12_FULL_44_26]
MDRELEKIVALYKTAASLKEMPRHGWIMEGASLQESDSVASHSFCVALISHFTASALAMRFRDINSVKVVSMAIFHDLGECATGEIATGIKRWIGCNFPTQSVVEKMEHEFLAKLLKDLLGNCEVLRLSEEYEQGSTREAKIVKFGDVLDAFGHAKLRLRRTFPQYLEHARAVLSQSTPGDPEGACGLILAQWLSDVEEKWDSVEKTRPWAL